MSQDVTLEQAHREHLVKVIREREAELEALKKEFEQFAHSVSHDLRAPLRALEGFSQILIEDYADKLDGEAKRALEIIASSSRKASLLVEDLLVLSRLGRQEMKPRLVKTDALLKSVFIQLGPDAERAEFKVGQLPDAWGDESLLERIWLELVKNALKFSRPKDRPVIEIQGHVESGHTVYAVRDNGVGFDSKYKDRLFGVFQRLHADSEFPGRGIGLAIVQRLVRRHGGEVWAEGKSGEGAVFYFSIPEPAQELDRERVLSMNLSQ